MRLLPVLGILVAAAGAVAWSCVFIVTETQQALLLAFGRFEKNVSEPGLHFKYPQPFNTVVYFDDRILPLEISSVEVTPLDNRRLVVSAFARFRITDPKTFYEAVQTEESGRAKLRGILITELRKVLGGVPSDRVLSVERGDLMRQIRDLSREEADAIGVTIVDVRIKAADLPEQNLAATYERMAAERNQEAADEIARGQEAAQIRRAQADREAVEIVSEARRESLIVQGEADAERARITAAAYSQDPEFFSFYLSLSALERTITDSTTSFVLTPGGDFAGELIEAISSDGAEPPAQ